MIIAKEPAYRALAIISIMWTLSCEESNDIRKEGDGGLNPGPSKIQVSKESGTWKLYKNGEPFFIKGVAGGGYFGRADDYGANTIRLYGINDSTRAIMDLAHENGLSVAFGLWMQQPEFGFKYTDPVAVQEQLDVLTEQVREYKDHPALLLWFLGNELDAHYTENTQKKEMWQAVNEVSKMIHREDPDHPTTIAIVNSSVEKLNHMKEWAPDLDIFCSNAKYPQTGLIKPHLEEAGWDMPFILSEFGNRALPKGFPESPTLEWGALVEPTSTEKAQFMRDIYEDDVLPNASQGCVGSFAFLWGDRANHQSGSRRNWHAVFNEEGMTYGTVDELEYGWTGVYPTKRAPQIEDRSEFLLNGQTAFDGIKLTLGKTYTAIVDAQDADPLAYEWVVVQEDATTGNQPPGIPGWVESSDGPAAVIRCKSIGAYRLYVFVKDDKGKLANAAIPFLVEE